MTEFHNRKLLRLRGFDYSSAGCYFVTFCTKERRCILSQIDTNITSGEQEDPTKSMVFLSEYGNVIKKNILLMNELYRDIHVDHYVIMPNHVHLLISLTPDKKTNSSEIQKAHITLSRFIGTLKRFCNKEIGFALWQSGFYDHIIRSEQDYIVRWNYINNNPLKWNEDEYRV